MESLSLLKAEPELAAGLAASQRRTAEEGLQVPVVRLPPGPWQPPGEARAEGLGYLLCAGTLFRRLTIEGGSSVELLGPGDCLLPWREETASFSTAEWQVVEHARLAILDLRPGSLLSRWPAIAATIAARAIDRSRALALQTAIMSVVGTEERLSALLWALAERWGIVSGEGTELKLDISQGVLAEMVGARRPTVSQALRRLCESGALGMPEPGRWVLHGEPPALGSEASAN